MVEPRPSLAANVLALLKLPLAVTAVVTLCAWLRFEAPLPWSYDEYYHLALAREMRSHLRLTSFWWTPFSTLYDRFVDSTPLFHALLMPFAALRLELASGLGVLLGQLFMVGAFAWALWSMRVPRPWWFVLALPALGTLFLQRLEMLRPHVWLIGFTGVVVALLVERRWKTLVVVCALFGLTHTGGWIAIPIAALWSLAGLVALDAEEGSGRGLPLRARVPWQPPAAAAGGWLLGQLVHPEVPANFKLFFIANFVVPFQATSAGNAALKSQLGTELMPPEGWILAGQWPAYVVAAIVGVALFVQPRLRSRATLTAALPALAFLLVGTVAIRRFLELGEPLALLALAVLAREGIRRRLSPPKPWTRRALAAAVVVTALITVTALREQGYGRHSAPLAMARWLGAHGARGERVFTAQWADSSPLFYAAPQLQSLVALDPTVFQAKDAQRFERYVAVVQGRAGDPAREIRDTFGCRWVTVWRMPSYQALALQLWRSPGMRVAYEDADYLVLDLGAR
ncbi:MAG TPA: hypothetical protein VGS57_16475 [Thermoanaerobaculia bacterium]|nr:hypothetical protein [Thermoanaerobaculia bacterium]